MCRESWWRWWYILAWAWAPLCVAVPVQPPPSSGQVIIPNQSTLTFINREPPAALHARLVAAAPSQALNHTFDVLLMDHDEFRNWISGRSTTFLIAERNLSSFDSHDAQFLRRFERFLHDDTRTDSYIFAVIPSAGVPSIQVGYEVQFPSLMECYGSTLQVFLGIVVLVSILALLVLWTYRCYRVAKFEYELDLAMRSGEDPDLVNSDESEYWQADPWDESVSKLALISRKFGALYRPTENFFPWCRHANPYVSIFRPWKREEMTQIDRLLLLHLCVLFSLLLSTLVRVLMEHQVAGLVTPRVQPESQFYKHVFPLVEEFVIVAAAMLPVSWLLRNVLTLFLRCQCGRTRQSHMIFVCPCNCEFKVRRSNLIVCFMLFTFYAWLWALFALFTCRDMKDIAAVFFYAELLRILAFDFIVNLVWYQFLKRTGKPCPDEIEALKRRKRDTRPNTHIDHRDSSIMLLDPLAPGDPRHAIARSSSTSTLWTAASRQDMSSKPSSGSGTEKRSVKRNHDNYLSTEPRGSQNPQARNLRIESVSTEASGLL